MANFNKLKKGAILGESQYYKVEKIVGDEVELVTDDGNSIVVDKLYVDKYLQSADQFATEEKATKTTLADLFITNARLPITVAFLKQNLPKTKKAYKEDLKKQAEQVQHDFLATGISAIEEAIANPVLDYIPGKLRVMRGRHYGSIDDLGRIQFTDMDIDDAHNIRQVDPRTIQYLIVNNIKYNLG